MFAAMFSLVGGCSLNSQSDIDDRSQLDNSAPNIDTSQRPQIDKWSLWSDGAKLRGANIFQRRVYDDVDSGSLGSGAVGSPYTQVDLNALSNLGANWIQISHPGLYSEKAPYQLDEDVQKNLDDILVMAQNANMFVTIAFRTGPGRSEFTFYDKEDSDWFPDSYRDDKVWEDEDAQQAWAEMWKHVADRYKDNPIVAGYNLMVEPNAESRAFSNSLDSPDDFYPQYADSPADWNQFYPQIVNSIRSVDQNTPVIVGGMGYSAVAWLSYLQPSNDQRLVYSVHQYDPFSYTHDEVRKSQYPGEYSYSGEKINLSEDYLSNLFSNVADYGQENSRPVTVDEFGIYRWKNGADKYIDASMELMENNKINYALWSWDSTHHLKNFPTDDQFDFTHGSDKKNHRYVDNHLLNVIKKHWARNSTRPY